jgi:hypothetical protein
MDKQQLRQSIREWVKLDMEASALKQKLRQLNQSKKEISARLLMVMKDENIDEIDLNQDGKLVRQVKKTRQSLSKKQLMASLATYYKSEEEAQKTTEFLLNSRGEKINETLCKK